MKKWLFIVAGLAVLVFLSACAQQEAPLTSDELDTLCSDQEATLGTGELTEEELAEVCAGYGSGIQAAPSRDRSAGLSSAITSKARNTASRIASGTTGIRFECSEDFCLRSGKCVPCEGL